MPLINYTLYVNNLQLLNCHFCSDLRLIHVKTKCSFFSFKTKHYCPQLFISYVSGCTIHPADAPLFHVSSPTLYSVLYLLFE